MRRPAGLNRRRRSRVGAHQHGAVDVRRHHQDAKEDGSNDGALKTQIIGSARHRQTRQVRVSAARETEKLHTNEIK